MDNYRRGEQAALDVLTALGRDAAHPALRYAQELGDEELLDLARRLVAVPPSIHTNLAELRAAAVREVAERGRSAPRLDGAAVTAKGSLALFDPLQVEAALVSGGRPARDPDALGRGRIAPLGLGVAGSVEARFVAAETIPPGPRRRLRVGSGVVAVGAPDAADGPRLGTVRLDPERTGLDDALDAGRAQLFRLDPGVYLVGARHPGPDALEVILAPDPDPSAPIGSGEVEPP